MKRLIDTLTQTELEEALLTQTCKYRITRTDGDDPEVFCHIPVLNTTKWLPEETAPLDYIVYYKTLQQAEDVKDLFEDMNGHKGITLVERIPK